MTRTNLRVGCSPDDYDRYTAFGVEVYDQLLVDRLSLEAQRLGRARLRVVDACTGTGQLLVRVASSPPFSDATFTAFDLFEDMVAIAREHVRDAGLAERVRVEVADIHALPYANGSADLVMARSVVHHWADPLAAFREIERILAPGGVAVIHEPRRDPSRQAYEQAAEGRRRAGIRPVDLDEKYTAEEVRQQLQAAGVRKWDVFAPEEGAGAIGFEVRIEKRLLAER